MFLNRDAKIHHVTTIYVYPFPCNIQICRITSVEAGSNTSTAALPVVRGDER
jgi:hypothetical protein